MDTKTICYCIVALLLGMLLANMLKNVCGCKVVEGQHTHFSPESVQGERAARYEAQALASGY